MLNKTRTTIIAAVASVSFAGVAVIPTVAQAAKINEEELKKDGYTCEKVTASFYICEKEGKKYYCTGDPKGKCELVPKRRPPESVRPEGPPRAISPEAPPKGIRPGTVPPVVGGIYVAPTSRITPTIPIPPPAK